MKEIKMKKLLSIIIIFLMFLVGCSNESSNIVAPVEQSSQQLSKESLLNLLPLSNILGTVTKTINGLLGGIIQLEQNILDSDGRVINAKAKFEVEPGAFLGIQTITMQVNADNGSIYFYPHMDFNKNCKLNFKLRNVNLSKLGFTSSDTKAEFVFFNENGGTEPIENLGVKLNYGNGEIEVNNAKIEHFSRYGFVRKDD